MDWSIVEQYLPLYQKAFFLTLHIAVWGILGSFLVGLVVSIVFLFLTVGNSLYRAITKYTPFDTTLLSLLWSSPYWDYPIFESMCKTGTGLITDVKQLEGKTLIVTKEITAETYFEKNHPEVKLQKYDQ